MIRRPPRYTRTDTLFPYTTLFRSGDVMSLMAADLLPLMLAAPVKAAPRNPEVTTGRDMLSGWDGSMTTNRPEPLIRSEEHTSELQSLMRISYAVFCLKKKNKTIRRDANKHRPSHQNQENTQH